MHRPDDNWLESNEYPPTAEPDTEQALWSNPEALSWSEPEAADPGPRPLRSKIAELPPARLLGYGCLGVIVIGGLFLYCLGAAAFVARPALLERPPTATPLIRPTLVPTPTQLAVPTFQLPAGTLVATPTQAPLPTREPATVTPTGVDPALLGTPSATPKPNTTPTATPTRLYSTPTRTPTVRPSVFATPGSRPSPTPTSRGHSYDPGY